MMEMQNALELIEKRKAMYPLELKPDTSYDLEITILHVNSKEQRLGY